MFNNLFKSNSRDLDGEQFRRLFESTDDAVLMDVRTPEEFSSGTIPGSVNMNYFGSEFQTKVQQLDTDKTYFLFCRSGNRSGSAANVMEKLGLKTFNLAGGIGEWPKN